MRRRVYLLDSLNHDAFAVIRWTILGNAHELVSPLDPPKPGIDPIVWSDSCVLVLSDSDDVACVFLPAIDFGMALGKGKMCVVYAPPLSHGAELLRPYLPPGRIFGSIIDLANFLKFEADCPF